MKLYIPMIGWDYEGGIVLGVFDTNQKAQFVLDEYIALNACYDCKRIVETYLNEELKIDI